MPHLLHRLPSNANQVNLQCENSKTEEAQQDRNPTHLSTNVKVAHAVVVTHVCQALHRNNAARAWKQQLLRF